MTRAWSIRAGEGGAHVEDFEKLGCVAIGWPAVGDIAALASREQVRARFEQRHEDMRPGQVTSAAGQVARFLLEVQVGDPVITYDSDRREYLVGEITSDYSHDPERIADFPHVRSVRWEGRVQRDELSVAARNSLGAIQTLFRLSDEVWTEIEELRSGRAEPEPEEKAEEELSALRQDVVERSREFIKDRVQSLDWDEMQELVAGILRAMGYRTTVSPRGPDRGKDVVASPDGLGLEPPRIRVEVKHRRKQSMGSSEVRSFLGGLRPNDKGLFVSTGGFTREAHYEAERSNVPVTLVDLDDLVSLLVHHYDALDSDARALVPLVRVYWPRD